MGVTVGKKIAGAARRTRGRRVMRESFRRLLPWIKEGTWIVASLRENALGAKADEVYADMALSLKRRGLLKAEWPGVDLGMCQIAGTTDRALGFLLYDILHQGLSGCHIPAFGRR